MNEFTHNFGESDAGVDPLGPCATFADVIRRQGLRFDGEGKKARASLAAMPGIENEQNVRRWGPVTEGGVGGELPSLRKVLDGLPHWPRAMQIDLLIVLTRGTGLALHVGPPTATPGVRATTLTQDAFDVEDQATALRKACYAAEQDERIDESELSNLQALGDGVSSGVKRLLMKGMNAVTLRPLRTQPNRGGR